MAFKKTDVYWIYLQAIIGFGSRKLLKVLDVFETAENFYNASYSEKINSKLFDKNEIARINNYEIESAYKIIDKCDNLYVTGTMPDIDDEVAVAIVGTRKASDYSRALAYELSERLARAGAVIVSGGAVGIDTSAHSGALSAKGKS